MVASGAGLNLRRSFRPFHRGWFAGVMDDLVDLLRIEIAGLFCGCPENTKGFCDEAEG